MPIKTSKTICVIELGGTITCKTDDPSSEFYSSEQCKLSSLINKIPLAENIGVDFQCPFRMISHEISKQDLIDIIKVIASSLDSKKYDGLVIAMGTNALEDVAYFAHLVLNTPIPIVFTGAHYPQNSLSFDGIRNLSNAINIAASSQAIDLGVLVTFGDYVVSARDAIKTTPGLPTNFVDHYAGFIGYVVGSQFILRSKPFFKKPLFPNFNLEGLNPSIRIVVIYGHLGMDDTLLSAAIDSGVHGIISAGFGKGYQPKSITNSLKHAVSQGITVVRCSRSSNGYSGEDPKYDTINGFIVSNGLPANKVSLLLFAALSFTKEKSLLEGIFEATK